MKAFQIKLPSWCDVYRAGGNWYCEINAGRARITLSWVWGYWAFGIDSWFGHIRANFWRASVALMWRDK
jgi:hypothetical protein